jgi:hemolysin activation/secretion protein
LNWKKKACYVLLLSSSVTNIPAVAQDYKRIAPKSPTPTVLNDVLPVDPVQPAEHKDGNAVIVPELKGMVFVANPDSIQASGVSLTGIHTGGIALLERPSFRAKVTPYLGQPLTFAKMNALTREVVSYYRAQNHPLVDVVVPQQDVQSGTLQIVITEFRVGKVMVTGNKWFSNRTIAAPLTIAHGDTIDTQKLLAQLDAVNTNPFRRVNLVYRPDPEAGYTDLVLQTQDRFPLRVYSGYDNGGTPVTGRNRWNFGAAWGNALWHGQQLSYQFTTSSDFWNHRSPQPGEPDAASFVGHSVSWTMPLSWRTSLNVFGAYEHSSPNIGQNFGLLGRSGQASIRYNLALPRLKFLSESVQVGYDFKTTNNNLDFGGEQISRNTTEIDQLPVSYSMNLTDRWGATAISSAVTFSPGGMTPNNNRAAFEPAEAQSGRPFANARYVYWRNDLNRITKLPANMTWATRMIGQVTPSSLLYTEQLAVGGPDLLRGYDPYSLLGDNGIILSNELRSPAFGPHATGKNDQPGSSLWGQTQVLGFWDCATLHDNHPNESYLANLDASSIGLGMRYNIRTHMAFRFDYGWQLRQVPGTNGRGQLANIALVLGN